MSAMLTADWCPLGRDTYFRKFEIYSMGWQNEINIENVSVAVAPYGGPIALIRDRKKFVKVQGIGKPIVSIYSASGKNISSIVWSSGQIIQLGWSSTEDLLCVQDDGSVLIYDMFGTYQHTFSVGQEVKDTKVIEAKIFSSLNGTGVAVLTSSYRIFVVNNVKDPKIRRLPEISSLNIPPSSWTVFVEDRQTRVLVAKDKDLYELRQSETHALPVEQNFTETVGSIVEMAVSQNNRHVALFADNGRLWIGSADFRKRYCEFDTKCPSRPKQLVWCGTEAVISYWDNIVLVIGRQGDHINYSYDSAIRLVPEMDGVRVLSSYSHEMIQKVPQVVQQIFRINSTEPGSYLLEASKQFQKRSHRADEYIRLVKDDLVVAVKQCVEAAGYEFDTGNQKMLVRAAQFGKGFIPDLNSESYVKMCRLLRVLNAVRDHKIGIPLTYTQMQHLTVQVLLDRLVLRRHYYLAIQIAKYLKLPYNEGSSRILAHWACYKVKQTQLDREQVARDIADKLGYAPGVSYSDIAMKAADCGRMQLAIKLMDYEPSASLQVPLLLRLGEDRPALVKAIESGDTDLVYTVLLHLRENMPLGEFQMAVRNYPVAQALYLKYCRDHNRETLRDIYVQEDDYNAQAACFIRESYDPKNTLTREASLSAAVESYKRARNEFCAVLCEEQQKLLRYQKTLEDKFRREFVGRSLHDTVYLLLLLHETKLADKLRTEYRVTDRRYWWLRILSLSELGDWVELDKFSKSKKSPIGIEPFVDACLKYGNQYEAQKYLPKVKDELKVKYYIKAGMFEEAARIAYEQKDLQALLYVQGRCAPSDRSLSDKINLLVTQLGTKK
ncbi:vacuolar protein sorting-associated protein 16 homolog [Periplaneta americana]|uniref:vacuolar protein sorting-associated protein 16 homolog n=1 Tax=Periplaneta americana TaxID=6978 RepID=UPI0037E7B11E